MTPADYMGKARRAITSARLLLADNDGDGACNRAYYAMFDAAHAALLAADSDLNPATIKTHRGLIAAFGEHLVKTGRTSADLGRSLNQVEPNMCGCWRTIPGRVSVRKRPNGPSNKLRGSSLRWKF